MKPNSLAELEADLLRAKIALETERNIQHLTNCDVWVNAGEKLIAQLESIIAYHKETHVEEMVDIILKFIKVAENEIDENEVPEWDYPEYYVRAKELIAKLEG